MDDYIILDQSLIDKINQIKLKTEAIKYDNKIMYGRWYRKNNKEKCSEYKKQYYNQNKKIIIEKQKEYYQNVLKPRYEEKKKN